MDFFGVNLPLITVIAVVIAHGLVFGLFCQYIAYQKARDGVTWFYVGFFFGIIALLALIGLARPDAKEVTGIAKENENMDCPKCAESIKKRAKVCRFCGFNLLHDKS